MDEIEPLITLKQFCEIFAISTQCANNWKRTGYGPPMLAVGSRQFYRKNEVSAFIKNLQSSPVTLNRGTQGTKRGRPRKMPVAAAA